MTIWFVSRHPGAIEWAKKEGLPIEKWVAHLDLEEIKEGDTVIGTLPIHLAAMACQKGASFFYLTVNLDESQRGKELTVEEMNKCDCSLAQYHVMRMTAKGECNLKSV